MTLSSVYEGHRYSRRPTHDFSEQLINASAWTEHYRGRYHVSNPNSVIADSTNSMMKGSLDSKLTDPQAELLVSILWLINCLHFDQSISFWRSWHTSVDRRKYPGIENLTAITWQVDRHNAIGHKGTRGCGARRDRIHPPLVYVGLDRGH